MTLVILIIIIFSCAVHYKMCTEQLNIIKYLKKIRDKSTLTL